ncbi:unnamed protein product [Acanthoscelides obtectus]|uniref:trypsin n=1 Tax=Acanthoscelides obtectus TaxID=200917 RepID=A0A9P0JL41_ACAOB|nr:unnamed protein product [Acanthoscelides obtectus]CAK1661091.1 Serine protease 41 [Acanthoscelides obtectus]
MGWIAINALSKFSVSVTVAMSRWILFFIIVQIGCRGTEVCYMNHRKYLEDVYSTINTCAAPRHGDEPRGSTLATRSIAVRVDANSDDFIWVKEEIEEVKETEYVQYLGNNTDESAKYEPQSNGIPVDYKDYSFLVDLTILDIDRVESVSKRNSRCKGTIIGRRWIMTAAHCFFEDNTNLNVLIYNKYYECFTKDVHVKPHEDYRQLPNGIPINDIALMRLKYDIDLEKYHIRISQIIKRVEDVAGREAVMIISNDVGMTMELRKVRLNVIGTSRCNELCKNTKISSKFHICVYNNKTNATTRPGDSGGPLLLGNSQIGVSSFLCNKAIHISVFTRGSEYYEWICDIIDKEDGFNEVCAERSFPSSTSPRAIVTFIRAIIKEAYPEGSFDEYSSLWVIVTRIIKEAFPVPKRSILDSLSLWRIIDIISNVAMIVFAFFWLRRNRTIIDA